MQFFLLSAEDARRANYSLWQEQAEQKKPLTKVNLSDYGEKMEISTPDPAGEKLIVQKIKELGLQFKVSEVSHIPPTWFKL